MTFPAVSHIQEIRDARDTQGDAASPEEIL